MDKILLTVEEAAEAMGLRRTKAYNLITSGELPSIKIGRSRRVPMAALAEFIERLRREQGQDGGD